MDVNKLFSDLAQYNAILAEAKAQTEAIKTQIREYMEAGNLSRLQGNEHLATLSSVTKETLDSKRLAADLPQVYNEYKKTTVSSRFNFK